MIPYFFPTTLLLIDDEPHVLRMNTRLFEAHPQISRVLSFTSAASALAFLDQQPDQSRLSTEAALVTVNDYHEFSHRPESTIRREVSLRLSELRQLMTPPSQDLVSAIVCDYAMPGLSGIDFFAALAAQSQGRNGIRRILLTALCDEQRAVQAFNAGSIHQFIQKADPAGPVGLERCVSGQLLEFFRLRSATLDAALRLGEQGQLFSHPALDALVQQQFSRLAIARFCFVPQPVGFLAQDAQGKRYTLMIADEQLFARATQTTKEIDGDAALIAALSARQVMPFDRDGGWIFEAQHDWRARALAPELAQGASALYWALISHPLTPACEPAQ